MKSKKINHSVKINIVLNGFKTVLGLISPLITFPYIARILSAGGIGEVSFSQSIVSYFSLLAGLGINVYAVREGAKLRDDRPKLERFIRQIFTINVITTLMSFLLMVLTIIIFKKLHSYFVVITICSLSYIFTTIGVDWINSIYEDYMYITIRTLIIQIVCILLLFVLVRSSEDVIPYAIFTILPQVLTGFTNLIYCQRYTKVGITLHPNISKHLKPLLILFGNNLATTLYCNSDIVMLGWMSNNYVVGLYTLSVKIYSLIRGVISSSFIVCIPRLSYYIGTGDKRSFSKLINKILCGLIIILIPGMAGIICLSKPLIMIMGGNGYEQATLSLQVLAFGLSFAIIGGVFTNCINIPLGKESTTLKATSIGAIMNIVLNLVLIPLLQLNGAAFTTVIAELSVLISNIVIERKSLAFIDRRAVLKQLLQSTFCSLLCIVPTILILRAELGAVITIIFVFIVFSILYFVMMIILRNETTIMILRQLLKQRSKNDNY